MPHAEHYAATIARHTELARDMLSQAHLVTPDPDEQAGALIIAATVLIERQVGAGLAPAALLALVAPTLACWDAAADAARQRPGEARH